MDLPAHFQDTAHGAPVVQVAQAAQPKCVSPVPEGTTSYRIGRTQDRLLVSKDAQGKPAVSLVKPDGNTTPLKPALMLPSPAATLITFQDNSVLTLYTMKSKKTGAEIPPTYQLPGGQPQILINEEMLPAATRNKPGCAPA